MSLKRALIYRFSSLCVLYNLLIFNWSLLYSFSFYLLRSFQWCSLSNIRSTGVIIQHFIFQLMHTTLKNVELLKHFKIRKTAPTCFGLQGNHHQEVTAGT